MNPKEPILLIDDLTGGLNTASSPMALGDRDCVTATNVEWWQSTMPIKRNGSSNVSKASWNPSFAIGALLRFVPAAGETAAELWGISADVLVARLAAGSSWTTVTPIPSGSNDLPTSAYVRFAAATSFNNKFFLAYASAVDKLHVWDGTNLRQVGMPTSAAATVADTGSGSYAATLRYYKVSYAELSGSTIIRQGELSASVTFTPSGSGTAARVTKPATVTNGETHWQLWASADDVNYYKIATTAVGTTTYDDSALPSSYSSAGVLAEAVGAYAQPYSGKYLTVLDNRVFMAGAWTTTSYSSRVSFTPVFGTTGIGDDERFPPDNYLDIERGRGGGITGIATFLGTIIVFKEAAMYKLFSTGDAAVPYVVQEVSTSIGCPSHRSIIQGRDATGGPALYWMSRQGPYRMSANGIEFLGAKLASLWTTYTFMSLSEEVHGVYYRDRHQIWWWVGQTSSKQILVYHVLLGAWSVYTGNLALAANGGASCMFANTLGSTMSYDQRPYVGGPAAFLYKADDAGSATDAGTNFQALVKTKAFPLAGPMKNQGITEAQLYAKALSGKSIRLTIDRDFGAETRSTDVTLTAVGSETRVVKKFEDAAMTSAQTVQFQLGDSAATNSGAWELDGLAIRLRGEEVR